MMMSPEVVFRYFDSVGVRNECPVCGGDRWTMHANTEREGTGVVQTRADGRDEGNLQTSLLYILVICQNCAFIRQHARPLIAQWAKERGEA